MFTPTVFKILMSKSRPVLSPTQRDTGNEIVKVSVKNQKNIQNLLKLLEKGLTYKSGGFQWFCNKDQKISKKIVKSPDLEMFF